MIRYYLFFFSFAASREIQEVLETTEVLVPWEKRYKLKKRPWLHIAVETVVNEDYGKNILHIL